MGNVQRLLTWSIVILPWLITLYLHFLLAQSDAWSPEQPFRGLMSVLLLGLGMLISFLLHGRLTKRRSR